MGWWTDERLLALLPWAGDWFLASTAAGALNVQRVESSYYERAKLSVGLVEGLSTDQAVALLNTLAASPQPSARGGPSIEAAAAASHEPDPEGESS